MASGKPLEDIKTEQSNEWSQQPMSSDVPASPREFRERLGALRQERERRNKAMQADQAAPGR